MHTETIQFAFKCSQALSCARKCPLTVTAHQHCTCRTGQECIRGCMPNATYKWMRRALLTCHRPCALQIYTKSYCSHLRPAQNSGLVKQQQLEGLTTCGLLPCSVSSLESRSRARCSRLPGCHGHHALHHFWRHVGHHRAGSLHHLWRDLHTLCKGEQVVTTTWWLSGYACNQDMLCG